MERLDDIAPEECRRVLMAADKEEADGDLCSTSLQTCIAKGPGNRGPLSLDLPGQRVVTWGICRGEREQDLCLFVECETSKILQSVSPANIFPDQVRTKRSQPITSRSICSVEVADMLC